ncbi:hypothetical protein BO83DRAFT_223140 [Aspergillus eucalypticola CBS 122712]|uniref:Uncharacterized protein n=1 Tax=Aspergillus eucalypticola (strain CBS 122712 / IBT 29274) TaxID=1448314 RepID=A0A317VV81_ASPEC|nr:uncharacterized protein BO83DRAFT_223140 [Aspergillus eucalypticola CBS 122712]PWY77695.1 hypothetical protein BO83DRAFT_223140 [Aspergillus eucalypticola CBS 122712]
MRGCVSYSSISHASILLILICFGFQLRLVDNIIGCISFQVRQVTPHSSPLESPHHPLLYHRMEESV